MTNMNVAMDFSDQMSGAISKMTTMLYSSEMALESVNSAYEKVFSSSSVLEATIEFENCQKEVEKLESGLDKVRKVAKKLGLGKIIKEQVSASIGYASGLEKAQSMLDTVFTNTSVIDDWAQSTLGAFGLSELSAKKYAGTMGALLRTVGVAEDVAADMSMQLTELAADMASFYNIDADDAFSKLQSAISGDTSALKKYNIDMSATNLGNFARAEGIDKAYSNMSQAEQAMVRYSYLLKATEVAQGDFARSSDTYGNQVSALAA